MQSILSCALLLMFLNAGCAGRPPATDSGDATALDMATAGPDYLMGNACDPFVQLIGEDWHCFAVEYAADFPCVSGVYFFPPKPQNCYLTCNGSSQQDAKCHADYSMLNTDQFTCEVIDSGGTHINCVKVH